MRWRRKVEGYEPFGEGRGGQGEGRAERPLGRAAAARKGYQIVTWNGLGFDFPLLAIECHDDGLTALIKEFAANHIDIGFQMLCEKGFMCGLNAAARGMKLSGKTEGMHGDLAPAMWKESREKQDIVLEYVAQDSRTTGEVYEAIIDQGGSLVWITKKGYPIRRPWFPTLRGNEYGVRLLKVAEAMELSLPDTSWMDDAWLGRSSRVG